MFCDSILSLLAPLLLLGFFLAGQILVLIGVLSHLMSGMSIGWTLHPEPTHANYEEVFSVFTLEKRQEVKVKHTKKSLIFK